MIAEAVEIMRLSEVCDFQNGFAFKSNEYSETGHFLIRIGNVQDGFVELNNPKYVNLNDSKLKRFELSNGDILISLTGYIGRVGLIETQHLPAALNQRVAKIVNNKPEKLSAAYLVYFLKSALFLDLLTDAGRGAAQQNVSTKDIGNIEIPIPPLPEQKRIVAKLDAAFAAIDAAKANVERNLQNAKELFQSKLNEVFSGEKEGWVKTTIKKEVEIFMGFAFKSAQYTSNPEDVKLLRGDNIMLGEMRWEGVKYWDRKNLADYGDYWLEAGDVVIAMDRTWIKAGLKYAVISEADLPCLQVQRTARLRSKASIDKAFLACIIGSPEFLKYVLSVQTGSGVPHISGGQIAAFEFHLPSLTEQARIAQDILSLQERTWFLQTNYTQKLIELETLKKSLLERAFRGEL